MSVPPWLALVLDRELPDHVGARRDQIAQRIIESIPRTPIIRAIAESAKAVLGTRNIKDAAGDISIEIARNAAQSLLFKLEGA